jgi:DNA-binding LytR/AlgR family response regulator
MINRLKDTLTRQMAAHWMQHLAFWSLSFLILVNVLKASSQIQQVDLDELFYAEALGDYIRIITEEKTLTVYERLSAFAERLPSDRFCRI